MTGITLPGVGSNLDVDAIVTKLMSVERLPMDQIDAKTQSTTARVSAFGSLKSLLASFQSTLEGLTAAKLGAMSATLADASLAKVSADSTAAEGSHTLEVANLAQAHRIYSGPFASKTDAVGTGTLTFSFGTWDGTLYTPNAAKPDATVTIGAADSTLAGIRDAVNAAGIGVSASIVNDGAGERLVFASADTGAASSLKITVSDGDGTPTDLAGLSQLAYDPAAAEGSGRNLAQAQAALDASFTLDGLPMTRPTNVVTGVLEGVSFTLAKAAPGSPTTLAVSRDTTAIQSAVQSFVDGYNNLRGVIATAGARDAKGNPTGALTGESILRVLETRLRSTIANPPAGLTGSLTTLSQAGVTLGSDGKLSLDATKFQSALAADPAGMTRLFAATGEASDSRIAWSDFTDKTVAGTYAVSVTRPASVGSLAGSAAAGLTITAGANDALSLTVDGVSTSVTLSPGTYASADALATDLASRLNASSALSAAGVQVAVTATGGVITIQSARFGAASTVTAAGGNAAAGLLGGAPVATAGQDVAGTIGGFAATGAGKYLAGDAGSDVEGLSIRVDATAAGSSGTVSFGRGFAATLAAALSGLAEADGAIDSRVSGLNDALKRYATESEQFQRYLDATEKRLRAQFAALDSLMASMNNTSSYLTQQLANLPGSYSSSK